jgi:hypothetical protein
MALESTGLGLALNKKRKDIYLQDRLSNRRV